jgi:hypothetical protein
VWKRKPTSTPTTTTTASVNVVRRSVAIVAPVMIAARLIGSERSRSITPFVLSSAMKTASEEPPNSVVWAMMPGMR